MDPTGGTAVPRRRPETVLAVWVQQPGALLAIEMGLRHMDSSEAETSAFRAAVLCAPCLSSRIMPQVWDSGPQSSESFLKGLSQMISMHSLLWKLLGSDPDGENVSPAATIVMHLMQRMAIYASSVSNAIDGKSHAATAQITGSRAERSESSSSGGSSDSSSRSSISFNDDSSSSDDDSTSIKQLLVYRGGSLSDYVRSQLLAVRGWVLTLKQTRAPCLAAAAAELYELCPGGDATIPSRMHVTLDACGLGQWRDGGAKSYAGVGALLGLDDGCDAVAAGHARWELFSLSNQTCPVQPGCSRWGCRTLIGWGEAALKTQLCGGCRRARYCSEECQRAAWVGEGHREVCGALRQNGSLPQPC